MTKYEFDWVESMMMMGGNVEFTVVAMVGNDARYNWESDYVRWVIGCTENGSGYDAVAFPVASDGTNDHDTPYIQAEYDNEDEARAKYEEFIRLAREGRLND